MYKAVYKCRLCEETFSCGKIHKENEAIKKIAKFSITIPLFPHDKGNTAHGCKDGSIGFSDFQGFKKVEE